MPFHWETMPEFLDHLETLSCACDFAALCAHGALRAYVMGERGADHSAPVTESDVDAMARLTRQAVEAGALGLGINRQPEHRDLGGNPVPGTFAPDHELDALGLAVQEAGGGVVEVVTDSEFFTDAGYAAPERALYERLATAATPVIFNCHPFGTEQDAELYEWLEAAAARGNDIRGVCSTKAINLLIGTDSNSNPFLASQTYRTLERTPLAQRVVELARPEVKATVLGEVEAAGFYSVFQSKFAMGALSGVYPMLDAPGSAKDWRNFEPQPADSVEALAEQSGQASIEWMYDFMLEKDGRSALIYPSASRHCLASRLPPFLTPEGRVLCSHELHGGEPGRLPRHAAAPIDGSGPRRHRRSCRLHAGRYERHLPPHLCQCTNARLGLC